MSTNVDDPAPGVEVKMANDLVVGDDDAVAGVAKVVRIRAADGLSRSHKGMEMTRARASEA